MLEAERALMVILESARSRIIAAQLTIVYEIG
jgi:hypothetical protein